MRPEAHSEPIHPKPLRFSVSTLLGVVVGVSFALAILRLVASNDINGAISLAAVLPLLALQLALGNLATFTERPAVAGALSGSALWLALYLAFGIISYGESRRVSFLSIWRYLLARSPN